MRIDGFHRIKIEEDIKLKTLSLTYNFKLCSKNSSVNESINKLIELSDDWFDYCLASLREIPALAFVGNAIFNDTVEKILKPYLREISVAREEIEIAEEFKNKFSYIIDEQDLKSVDNKLEDILRIERASNSISRSHLSSIIAEFEFFCVRLAQISAKMDPLKFISGNENIKISELLDSTKEDIINKKVEAKISDEMRGSHDGIISWLAEALDIGDISQISSSPHYIDFMEACQRRHILAHNGGIVNKKYLEKCEYYKVPKEKIQEENTKIKTDQNYLKKISGRTFLLGLFILHMKIQKFGEHERLASLNNLLSISHDFILHGQTKMAVRVLDFAEQQKKSIPAELKLSFGINRALTFLKDKNINKENQIILAKKSLEKYDWSVITPIFRLAKACACRDFENIFELAKKAYEDGLDYSTALSFVVFSEAREIPGFMDCFPRRPLQIQHDPQLES